MKTVGERIKSVRKRHGLTQKQFAEQLGVERGAVGNWERGGGIDTPNLAAISDLFAVSLDWLANGPGPRRAPSEMSSEDVAATLERPGPRGTVKLKGYVGAGSKAHFYALGDEEYDEVPAPPGATANTVAVEIKGNSLGKMLNSWLAFYDDVRSPVTPDQIGKFCVVGLADDQILIKQIEQELNGKGYRLISGSPDEPDIRHAEIVWAAELTGLRPTVKFHRVKQYR